MSDENDLGEITVTGAWPSSDSEASVRFYTPATVDEGGAGGGGGGSSPPNPPEHSHTERTVCPEGSGKKIGEKINNLKTQVGNFEFGALIQRMPDNTFGAYGNGIHTDHNAQNARLPFPSNPSSIVGVIHNHVWDFSVTGNMNAENRYPSGEAGSNSGDWSILDALVSPPNFGLGADANNLSMYIVDPWGTTREFKYSDKGMYQNMDRTKRNQGENLPGAAQDCPAG